MIKIILKGGVVKEYAVGVTPMEVARDLGANPYKAACAAQLGDKTIDIRPPAGRLRAGNSYL